jgi:hypothetical protein
MFNTLGIHDYNQDSSKSVRLAHSWLKATGHANYPIWLTEWGSFDRSEKYDTAIMGISVINNLIRASQPGDDYIYGSHIFALYDFGSIAWGLIGYDGTPRLTYYAMRMAIRALQGCRPTYQSVTSDPNLLAITTRERDGSFSLLVTNQNTQKNKRVDVDLSALITSGKGQLWQFDASHRDQNMGNITLGEGHALVTVSPQGALLLKFTP